MEEIDVSCVDSSQRDPLSLLAYFVLFYKSIEEVISMGKEWLELGVTNYNPKIEVGAIPDPMSIYAKSLDPIFSFFWPRWSASCTLLSVSAREALSMRSTRGHAWKRGLVILKMKGEHTLRWQDFVQHFPRPVSSC